MASARRGGLLSRCANEALGPDITGRIRLLNATVSRSCAGRIAAACSKHHLGHGGRFALERRAPTSTPGAVRSKGAGLDAILSPSRAAAPPLKIRFMLAHRSCMRRGGQGRAGARHLGYIWRAQRHAAGKNLRPDGGPTLGCSLSTASASTTAEGPAGRLRLRGEGKSRKRICAAARPAPTTSCSRTSRGGCAPQDCKHREYRA